MTLTNDTLKENAVKNFLRNLIAIAVATSTVGVATFADSPLTRVGSPQAVTLWWVVFNAPENCGGSPDPEAQCTAVDVFGAPFLESVAAGSPDPTLIAPNLAAEPAVLFGTGGATDKAGRVRLVAALYRTPGETAFTLPAGVDPMGFGRGLTSADAEIHLVVRNHGRVVRDDLLPQITNFLDPYCSDPNLWYFAGKNTCADTHFAVFGPAETGADDVYAFADPGAPVAGAKATLLRDGDVIRAVVDTRLGDLR